MGPTRLAFTKVEGATDPFDPSKLDGLSKWAASGFVLLTSLLGFFGIRDGYLNRVLREEQTATLWVFVLLGIGVVASLLASAMDSERELYQGWVGLAVVGLGGCTAVFLDQDLKEAALADALLVGMLVIGLAITVAAWLHKWSIAWPAGLLVIAVAATSMGLYAAAKISVASLAAPTHLRTKIAVTGTGGSPALDISVTGSKQQCEGEIVLSGRPASSTGSPRALRALWRASYRPDDVENVDEKHQVPVPGGQWRTLRVDVTSCDRVEEVARVHLGPPLGPAQVDGSVARVGGGVRASLRTAGMMPGESVRVLVRESAGGERRLVTRATVSAQPSGKLAWQAVLPQAAGRATELSIRVCTRFGCGKERLVAKLAAQRAPG